MVKDRKYLSILALLWFFHLTVNFLWLEIHTAPPTYDAANHLLQNLAMYDIVKYPQHSFTYLYKAGCYKLYPPLMHFTTFIFYPFFGANIKTAILGIDIVFFAILFIAIFKIGVLLEGPRTGLFAAFLTSMYPFIYRLSRYYMLDFPLTAMVIITIYFLLKTEEFRNLRYTLLTGVSFGLGLLTKELFIICIAGPFIYVCLTFRRLIQFRRLLYALFSGIAIAAVWYYPQGKELLTCVGRALSREEINSKYFRFDPASLKSIFFYFHGLIFWVCGVFYMSLFFLSVFFIKRWNREKKIIMVWIISTLVIFTFLLQVHRYSLPVLPGIALITACGFMSIKRKAVRRLLITLVVCISLLEFTILTTGQPKLENILGKSIPEDNILRQYLRGWVWEWTTYPRRENWQGIIDDFLQKVDLAHYQESPYIYLASSHPFINEYTLRYLLLQRGLNLYLSSLVYCDKGEDILLGAKAGTLIMYAHCWEWPILLRRSSKLIDIIRSSNDLFSLVFRRILPDGIELQVYRKS